MARSTSLYEHLTCSVCLECYKDPRTLPCHHSFCRVCLDNVPAPISDEEFEETGQPTIMCPVCRNSVLLPPGGVKELPAAFLINNLLEIQKAVNVQLPTGQALCDKHERVLEFYCNDCDVLLCSVCSIKVHRAHDCDLASDVAIANKKVIQDQLALLRRDVSIVDSMIANVGSANDRMISDGDEIRKAIRDAVDQLYRQIEEEKRKLLTMVDQNIVEKLQVLKNHRDKGIAMITQMRRSESVVEGRLEKFKDSIEIMAVKDQLVQLVSASRLNCESIKFTAPNMLSFHSNPIPSTEIGFLFEPAKENANPKFAAGKKCQYMLYHTRAETSPVCHLVPSKKIFMIKPLECQVAFLENGKYEISFTPTRVGDHDLILFPLSPIKKTTAAQLLVNSPFLQENQKQISKQTLSKPSAMAITRTGDLVVCETANDSITFLAGADGKRLNRISSLSSSKKCLNKPCCVGVTPDNCIIVVDSGKQCYRLLKIQMNGKLISTASLADKLKFQSPNALAIHPSGEIFVVDSDAHSIYVFNADLTLCRNFGEKGKAHGYFDQPHSIAFDSAGSAYVSDSMNDRIQKFSTSEEGSLHQFDAVFGSGIRSEPSYLKRPTALCISCYDTIFVTDEHSRIAAFDTQGCFLGEVRYSKISLTNPCAMVIGKDESHLSVLDSYVEALYIIQ